MEQQILHITDLHGGQESKAGCVPNQHPLRTDFFRLYIGALVKQIRAAGLAPQCIVATGDFVDRHRVDLFPDVKMILDHLATSLGLTLQNVALCMGNHDVIWEMDRAGQETAARSAYINFAQDFANGAPTAHSAGRAVLCQPALNIWCLALDSTFGSRGLEVPGALQPHEKDEICKLVQHVPPEDVLVIASHFPTTLVADSLSQLKIDWIKKHAWLDEAAALRHRIEQLRDGSVTIWASGDTHAPDYVLTPKMHYLMTGCFGTAPNNSRIARQAAVAVVTQTAESNGVFTFSWAMPKDQHEDVPDQGSWETGRRPFRLSLGESERRLLPEPQRRHQPECINDSLQRQIMRTVAREKLYHLGRFQTSQDAASLSWISIGPLLNEEGIFPLVVARMHDWLKSKGDLSASNTIFLGIDCWGAIIATQLSVVTGIQNICFAARTDGATYSQHERLTEGLIDEIGGFGFIVLVSDVVATGTNLRTVFDAIVARKPEASKATWFALSVLCSDTPERDVNFSFLQSHGTACRDMRMLVMSNDKLPDVAILPADIVLHRI